MSLQNKVPLEVPLMERDLTGRGQPLVLIPGGLTGWISWLPHTEILANSRSVIRLQLHSVALGLSGDPLPADYSLEYEIAALHNTLDHLAIEAADFAAWSLGAEITLSFAIRNPGRVNSLTLVEPPAFWVLRSQGGWGPLSLSPELPDEQMPLERQFLQSVDPNDVTEEQLIEFTHIAGFVPEEVDPRSLPLWPVWFEHRQSLRNGDVAGRHEDNMDLVRAFDKPVLLVKGEGSNPTLHSISDILAEELPDAQVVTFPGGHAAHILSMQSFMERFSRFLSSPAEIQ